MFCSILTYTGPTEAKRTIVWPPLGKWHYSFRSFPSIHAKHTWETWLEPKSSEKQKPWSYRSAFPCSPKWLITLVLSLPAQKGPITWKWKTDCSSIDVTCIFEYRYHYMFMSLSLSDNVENVIIWILQSAGSPWCWRVTLGFLKWDWS